MCRVDKDVLDIEGVKGKPTFWSEAFSFDLEK
jgi:hypothetical protein